MTRLEIEPQSLVLIASTLPSSKLSVGKTANFQNFLPLEGLKISVWIYFHHYFSLYAIPSIFVTQPRSFTPAILIVFSFCACYYFLFR